MVIQVGPTGGCWVPSSLMPYPLPVTQGLSLNLKFIHYLARLTSHQACRICLPPLHHTEVMACADQTWY